MPDSAAGKTIRSDDLQLAGAEAERALAQRRGHRGHRVLGDRGDRRQHEQADDDARRQRVELVDPMPSRPRRISGVKNVSAKKPKTIVGTPASTSSTGLTTLRTRGGAYSAR